MDPIFTSLSPNVEKDDVALALKLLARPWKWYAGDDCARLENWMKDYLGVKYAYTFESGRSALYAILASLALARDEEVLLQAFTCVAVPNAVLWAGARPVYVDIDHSTFNMSLADLERKISPRARAIIVQHTFGNPAPMNRILDIARAHDLFIIEDCAHALGARYLGKKAGTFGHAAFFSFGRDKIISSVFGGVAVCNGSLIATRIEEHHRTRDFPRRRWLAKKLLHPILTSIAKNLYRRNSVGKAILAGAKRARLLSPSLAREEYHGGKPAHTSKKMAPVTAALVLHQIEKLERFYAHRRHIALLYHRLLAESGIKTQKSYKNSDALWLRFPVLINKPNALLETARAEGVYLGDWYRNAIAPAGVRYDAIHYVREKCPVAEAVAKRTVNLPTDIHISDDDAQRIVRIIKRHLTETII